MALSREELRLVPKVSPIPSGCRARPKRSISSIYPSADEALSAAQKGANLSDGEHLVIQDCYHRLKTSQNVQVYRCPYGNRKSYHRCSYSVLLVERIDGTYHLEIPADHEKHQLLPGHEAPVPPLSAEAKDLINEHARVGAAACQSIMRLTELGHITSSSRDSKKVYNQRNKVKKEENILEVGIGDHWRCDLTKKLTNMYLKNSSFYHLVPVALCHLLVGLIVIVEDIPKLADALASMLSDTLKPLVDLAWFLTGKIRLTSLLAYMASGMTLLRLIRPDLASLTSCLTASEAYN